MLADSVIESMQNKEKPKQLPGYQLNTLKFNKLQNENNINKFKVYLEKSKLKPVQNTDRVKHSPER